ncbi:MAG: glycosyltransferase family 4 protein [Candidatus Sumerlaeia bacterium]
MKIAIDVRTIREGMTGIGHYTSHLIKHLLLLNTDNEFVFLWLRGQDPALRPSDSDTRSRYEYLEVDVDYEDHPRGDFWMHWELPKLLRERKVDVFHGPSFSVPHLRMGTAARVVTIHDLTPFSFPDVYPLRFRLYLRMVMYFSLRAADRVLCGSDFVRQDIERLWPRSSKGKIRVAPLASDFHFTPEAPESFGRFQREMDLPEQYLLMVGTFERRKNPLFFLHLYEYFQSKGRDLPPVIWAGKLGYGADELLPQFEPMIKRGRFRIIDCLDQGELSSLNHGATMLVYPSLGEGFGLPLVEALACGLPVIAADNSCQAEIVGDGGKVLPLKNLDLWADAIRELLEDPQKRKEAHEKALRRAPAFSWMRTAEKTLEVYEDAARLNRGGQT